jgi:hypothetical protein
VISKRILTQIEALRQAMTMADGERDGSFAEVFSSFLDIAEDRGLFSASKPVRDALVRSVIEAASRKLTGDETTTIERPHLLRVGSAGMVHGGFFAGRFLGTFFWFEKEQQGLLAFYGGGTMTHLIRLTVTELPEGAVLVPGPSGKQ